VLRRRRAADAGAADAGTADAGAADAGVTRSASGEMTLETRTSTAC